MIYLHKGGDFLFQLYKGIFKEYIIDYYKPSKRMVNVKQAMLEDNMNRIKYIAFITIILEMVLIVFYDLRQIDEIRIFDFSVNQQYFKLHLVMLIISVIVLVAIYRLRRKTQRNWYWRMQSVMYGYMMMMLSVLAYITGLDQLISHSVLAYIVYFLIATILTILPPPRQIWVFGVPTLIFYLSINYYQLDPDISKINIINGLLFSITMMGVSIINYFNYVSKILKDIDIEEKNKRLEYLANFDALTGLMNRRKFENLLNELQGKEGFDTLAIVLMDIDYFKKINDNYGHFEADQVLIKLSERLKSSISDFDKVARWGGEEFIFLLQRKDLNEIIDFVEGLRKDIEERQFHKIFITASFGISKLENFSSEKLKAAFINADQALYQSKSTGRNKTTVKYNQ